jgi:hypothetical protein
MKITNRLLFTTGLVIVLAAYVFLATTYNYQARMMPLIIGVPVLLLAATQVIREFRESAVPESEMPEAKAKEANVSAGRPHRIKVYAWVLAIFGAVYLFGFIISTLAYPLLYLRFVGGRSWRLSAGISIGALAFLYIVMINGLNVELYEGVVVLALRKMIYAY